MPTYKFEISELVHRHNAGVEIEAESLADAMAQLADEVMSPNYYWRVDMRDLMVVELTVDDETILEDTRSREDGNLDEIFPRALIKDGRVWEGDGEEGGEYLMENMPKRVQELIEDEEGQAE